jgi:outer membrane protein OmpA-like peptidoglycan-associated protein/ABC-type nitrate/sulfonate/bicarbonate transport system substrate-binding protein
MSERRSKAILLVAGVWIVIIGLMAGAYKLFIAPVREGRLADSTGSESLYTEEVTLALDAFSGYSILRSDAFRDDLRQAGVKLSIEDDGADYAARIRNLRKGRVQLATFTIDSLITASAALGEFPATIVLIIDETQGADAIVAHPEALASFQDLNHSDARIVLTPDSPSEFLARTAIAHFSLPDLSSSWLVGADGPEDVLRKMQRGPRRAKTAYVLWEPYVSQAVQQGANVLIDSSRVRGFIVDVLVARRDFVQDHPHVVRTVIESYLRANHDLAQDRRRMVELVQGDAADQGLTDDQAERLVDSVRWKNTLENYAHFGISTAARSDVLPHIEDMIDRIMEVLLKTEAVDNNPLDGRTHTLFFDRILREMHDDGFHPGKSRDSDSGTVVGEMEEVRYDAQLANLTEWQWERLVPIGQFQVTPIRFARGAARINVHSQRELGALAKRLVAWPTYYVQVVGHARAQGDADANMALALARAQAARSALVDLGLAAQRIRARAAQPSGHGGGSQTVSFEVGQLPY